MVSRSKRLQMMFAGDEELLHLDTRLTLQVSEPIPFFFEHYLMEFVPG
jgi:hypothetical protein